ncbi:MAG: ABC transporter permease [Lachnospiraceae bacterium]|nr:ABC transporter permease [Lachnospiraceae bacterium]
MQVYKLFLKILRSQLGQVIMYICIFTGIINLISGQKVEEGETTYKAVAMDIAIVDNSSSVASKEFTKYVDKGNEIVELEAYDSETIQDELFNRTVSAVIVIPKDYENRLMSGDTKDLFKVYSIPGTFNSDIVSGIVDGYIGNLHTFLQSGMDMDTALSQAARINDIHAETTLLDNSTGQKGLMYYFFSYLAYVLICIVFVSAISILIVLNKETIRARMTCSSYKLSKISRETGLGLATIGVAICAVFSVEALITIGSDMFTVKGVLYIANMIIYMTISIALAFFIGQLVNKENLVSMIANIIGLGFSFLGGVFVPLEFMGEGIKKVAHFLPSFWYITACEDIDTYTASSDMNTILICFGIQLIFAVVFFTAGGVAIKAKQAR